MPGIVKVWTSLPASKQLVLVIVLAATVFAFSWLARTASAPQMALLYSGLDSKAAGEVVSALEQMDVPTDIRDSSIFVPANQRDSVRMKLAREGLPQQGQAGYELFESLNGFSTTSDIFDVTYWRAMEGELARTILATRGVTAARVHIGHDRGGSFSRRRPEPTAVVTVSMGRGELSTGQAHAIRYLISSSVAGLSADKVAVLDSVRGVILSPGSMEQGAMQLSGVQEREQRMEADILNLLEARVGSGNARVQVAVEIDNEREAITERVIDPEGRVISGKETTEVTERSSGTSGGSVTVASNLPEGDGAGGRDAQSTERTQADEILSYDLSEVRREREKQPGAVKRLSIAVLVNEIEALDANGEPTTTPRPEEELEALRDLVANAAGLNEGRGDTITIHSMPFQPIASEGVTVESNATGAFLESNLMTLIQIAVLSVVTLVLGLFVVRPLLKVEDAPAEPIAPPVQELAVETPPPAPQQPDAIETLKTLAGSDTDKTADLIQAWLEEPENAA